MNIFSFRANVGKILVVALLVPFFGVMGPLATQANASTPGSIYFNDFAATGGVAGRQFIQINPPNANTSLYDFSGAFSIEMWVKRASRFATGYADLVQGSGGTGGSKWIVQSDNSGCLALLQQGVGDIGLTQGSPCIVANTWTHFVLTRYSDNFLAIYLNGKLYAYKANYTANLGGPGSTVYIGDGPGSVTHSLQGQISNVRIVNSAVYGSPLHNDALNAQVFTSPTTTLQATQTSSTNISAITAGQTSLLLNTLYDGTLATSISDSSGNGSTIISSNGNGLQASVSKSGYDPVPDNLSPFAATTPGSFYLDNTYGAGGTRKTVSVDLAGLGPGTGDFTYELWFKNLMDSATNPSKISTDIIGTRDGTKTTGAGSNSNGFDLFYDFNGAWTSPNYLNPKILVYQAPDNYTTSTARPATATWNHLVYERSSGVGKIFLNGVLASSGSDTRDFGSSRITLGEKWPLNNEGGFRGYMSNFRYVKGLAVYSGNFTVPTSPLGATQSSGTNIAAITTQTKILLNTPYSFASFLGDGSSRAEAITNGGATVSSDSPFAPPPTITSLSVTSGIGTGGTSTIISGANLDAATSVTVGGAVASIITNTSTAITITTPARSDGAKDVVVTTAGGSVTSVGAFTYFSKYSITYSGGDGSGGTAPTQVSLAPAETFTVASGSSVSKNGYTFAKWKDANNVEYLPGATFTVSNSAITLTAQWVIDTHQVAFNANGGSNGSTATLDFNSNALASAPTVTRSNYSLVGWAETTTASVLPSWTVVGEKTLYAIWSPKVYTITYSPESGTATTASETFTVLTMPSTWQIPVRNNYAFDGWYTDKTWATLRGTGGSPFTSNETETVYAKWTQSSLVGLTNQTPLGTINATPGNDGGMSASRSGIRVEVDYFADSLPDNTVITAYLQDNTTRAASVLTGVSNLLLSVVVAWKAPDETVPDVDPTKSAIRMKITNAGIKSGAKVYSIVNDTSTVLATASQDGFVVIDLRVDPEIVIANPVDAPLPPGGGGGGGGGGGVFITTPSPSVDDSEKIKAAEVKAAEELKIAREKAEAEIKAAQAAADLGAKLKAEEDAQAAAKLKAEEDAARAVALVAQNFVPELTLYSISSTLKLSTFDSAYLNRYISTLKKRATVTCIGYIYPKRTTMTKARALATSQATAVCKMIKAKRKTLVTRVQLLPSSKAPKAAVGSKWVAVSYRVDGYKS